MKPTRLTALCTLTLGAALGTTAHAADGSWNVNAAGSWSTSTNWASSAVPGSTSSTDSGDIATFGFTLGAGRTVTVDASRNIGGITFSNTSAFGYTLSGGSLKLSNAGTIQLTGNTGAHTETISSPIEIQGDGGSATFANSSTLATRLLNIGAVSGVSTAGKTTTLTLNGGQTPSGVLETGVSGVISDGSGGGKLALVKDGTGAWTIGNALNTFSGGTEVKGGILRITNAGALGSGGLTLASGSTVHLINNSNSNFAANVSITGNTTISSTKPSGISGNISHSLGTLSIGTSSLTVSKFFNTNIGALTFGSTSLTGVATFSTSYSAADNQTTLTLGAVSGGASSGITKTGTGTMILSANNPNYAGTTLVSSGTLQIGAGGTVGDAGSGSITVSSGATLAIARSNSANVSNAISGAGSVRVTGGDASVIQLTDAGHTGATLHQRGILFTNNTTSNIVLGTVGSTTIYPVLGLQSDFTGSLGTSAGNISWATGNNTSGGFAVMDAATRAVNLGGNATPSTLTLGTGGFVGGTLSGNNSRLSFGDLNGTALGTVDFRNPIELGGGTRSLIIIANGQAHAVANLGGAVTGSGLSTGTGDALVKFGDGNLMLSGANTYTGRTVVGGNGSIILGSASAFSPNSWMHLNGGAAGTLGGILGLGSGDLAATLGQAAGQVHFATSGGFAAFGGDRTVTLNGGSTLTWGSTTSFVLAGQNLVLGQAKADGTITLANPIDLNGAARTVHVNDGSAAIDAELAGGLLGSGAATWVKGGTGTLALGGTSTYTGNTTVSTGRLLVNGSITSSALTTVGAGAILGGSGTLGATTITGTHSPGNSPGVQTVAGDLSYLAGASLVWELISSSTAGRGTTFDGIDVSGAGNLVFAGATSLDLDFALAGSAVRWTDALWDQSLTGINGWKVFDLGTGSITGLENLTIATEDWTDGSGATLSSVRPGSIFTLVNDGNDLYLNFTNPLAIPEPGSLLGLGLLLGAPTLLRRRKQA